MNRSIKESVLKLLNIKQDEFLKLSGLIVFVMVRYHQYCRILLVLCFLYIYGSVVLMIVDAIYVSSWTDIGPCIAAALPLQWDMAIGGSLIYYRKNLVEMLNTIRADFRPIVTMNPVLMKRMLKRRFYINIQSMSLLVLYIVLHWYGSTPTSEGEDRYMYYRLLPKRIFKSGSAFIYICYLSYYFIVTVLSLSSYALSSGILYTVVMINFQYHLLVDDMNNKILIHQGVFSLINNSYYQGIIYKNLKHSVEDLRDIEKVLKMLGAFQSNIMLVCLTTAALNVIFVFYGIVGHISPPSQFKLYFTLVIMAYVFVVFATIGQELTDASTEFYDKLCECPWHYWNTTNRKMLLFMLTNFKEKSVGCFGLLHLNRNYIVMNCRWWYSLLCFSKSFSIQLKWLDGMKQQQRQKL